MASDQRRKVASAIVNRVSVIRRLPTTQSVAVLPEYVAGNTVRGHCCSLPRSFNGRFVGPRAVFF